MMLELDILYLCLFVLLLMPTGKSWLLFCSQTVQCLGCTLDTVYRSTILQNSREMHKFWLKNND